MPSVAWKRTCRERRHTHLKTRELEVSHLFDILQITNFNPCILVDYVQLKDRNMPGPWAVPAYVAPAPRLTNLGVQSLMNHVPGQINFRVGSAKVDYITETAAKKKALPAPNHYKPIHWRPANNFQKQTKTPKVTMTAAILKHKKQVGPGSHKVKFDSRYHG